MKKYALAAALFLFSHFLFAQDRKTDSLRNILAHANNDKAKIDALNKLAFALENSMPDSSIAISGKALVLAKLISWPFGVMNAQYVIGVSYDLKGQPAMATAFEDSSLAVCLENKYDFKLDSLYNALGNALSEQNQYSKAFEYYFKAVAIDTVSHKSYLPDIYNNIGLDYQELGDYITAEEYYYKSMRIYNATNNEDGLSSVYGNLGNIYTIQRDYKKGLEFQLKSLEIDERMNKQEDIVQDYSNIGDDYMAMKDFVKALEYDYKAINLSRKIGSVATTANVFTNMGLEYAMLYADDSAHKGISYMNGDTKEFVEYHALIDSAVAFDKICIDMSLKSGSKVDLIYAYSGMGDAYIDKKDNDHALACYQFAYRLADSLKTRKEQMDNAVQLARTYVKMGKYQDAAKYFGIAITLKDSLFGKEKQEAIGKLEAKLDYDKKFVEQRKEGEKQKAIAEEKDKREKFVIGGVSVVLIIVVVFLIILFKRFRVTDAQRKIIERQKQDVDAAYRKLNDAHTSLQEKDKDISDSIAYARKIQAAILTSKEYLNQALGEHFVLFKPRDVVSGDFYWCYKVGDKVLFAVADCTGHGVPGAFMSMIGNSLLNQVVIENKVYNTTEILKQVRTNLLKQLQQNSGEVVSRDGMDMCICIWDKAKNTLQCAGANNPVYIVRSGINSIASNDHKLRQHGNDLLEILPDKQPIGYQEGRMDNAFSSYTIQLQKGDYIYLTSDGYHDQFGGERNKKFTSRAFRDLLVSLKDKSIIEQKSILNNTIEQWKATYAQTDDICVLGVKVV